MKIFFYLSKLWQGLFFLYQLPVRECYKLLLYYFNILGSAVVTFNYLGYFE